MLSSPENLARERSIGVGSATHQTLRRSLRGRTNCGFRSSMLDLNRHSSHGLINPSLGSRNSILLDQSYTSYVPCRKVIEQVVSVESLPVMHERTQHLILSRKLDDEDEQGKIIIIKTPRPRVLQEVAQQYTAPGEQLPYDTIDTATHCTSRSGSTRRLNRLSTIESSGGCEILSTIDRTDTDSFSMRERPFSNTSRVKIREPTTHAQTYHVRYDPAKLTYVTATVKYIKPANKGTDYVS